MRTARLKRSPAVLGLCASLGCATAQAAEAPAPSWTLLPRESTLMFSAQEEGQEAEGGFSRFGGTIVFDPAHLDRARIDLTIDVSSVASSYETVATTLKGAPWFDTARFPQARFLATAVRADAKGTYVAEGALTLRGVTVPVAVTFHFDSLGPKPGAPHTLRAVAKGGATLSRTAFGVGQGEWKATDVVADPVRVTFTLTAERPAAP